MSAAAQQLERDIRALEAEHDALKRTITRRHQELDQLLIHIRAREADLAKINAEIKRIKAHFGV
jgi:hypothetical protein